MTYWLDLFTAKTWQEFLDAGSEVSGFREGRWSIVKKIKPGDRLLCYLTGISRFIGILEVVSEPFQDTKKIWEDADFPCRLKVKVIIALTPETAVPVLSFKDQLSCFQNLKNPNAWSGAFRGSPARWEKNDGMAVENVLMMAQSDPVVRSFDRKKLDRRPQVISTAKGSVVIPEVVNQLEQEDPDATSDHNRIQHQLLKLGADLGLNVWVASNDKGKSYNGSKFSEVTNLVKALPVQFDEATNKTIRLIDVLWLKGNAIVAAFEIESTTSIYSGLLRMADLVSMQPNINIPLYIVAPEERRNKVLTEVNRPTFSRLPTPLCEICRFISFTELERGIQRIKGIANYIRPEFLDEISESCDLSGED